MHLQLGIILFFFSLTCLCHELSSKAMEDLFFFFQLVNWLVGWLVAYPFYLTSISLGDDLGGIKSHHNATRHRIVFFLLCISQQRRLFSLPFFFARKFFLYLRTGHLWGTKWVVWSRFGSVRFGLARWLERGGMAIGNSESGWDRNGGGGDWYGCEM